MWHGEKYLTFWCLCNRVRVLGAGKAREVGKQGSGQRAQRKLAAYLDHVAGEEETDCLVPWGAPLPVFGDVWEDSIGGEMLGKRGGEGGVKYGGQYSNKACGPLKIEF